MSYNLPSCVFNYDSHLTFYYREYHINASKQNLARKHFVYLPCHLCQYCHQCCQLSRTGLWAGIPNGCELHKSSNTKYHRSSTLFWSFCAPTHCLQVQGHAIFRLSGFEHLWISEYHTQHCIGCFHYESHWYTRILYRQSGLKINSNDQCVQANKKILNSQHFLPVFCRIS